MHRREEEFRVLVENSPDIVLKIDRNMQVTYANPAIERTNGIPCSICIGAKLADLPCPVSLTLVWEESAKRVFENGRERTVEYEILTPMGLQWHECRLAPELAEDGSVAFVLMFARDITDRRRMQEDLFKTKKFEAISTLAGGIAHDFNNLLMVILGNINLAEISLDSPDIAQKALKQSEKACSHATALVRQILLLSQGKAPFKRVQSIGHLIDDAVGVALSGSDVRLKLSVADDLWPIDCDFGQIHQALVELVMNARDAMSTSGVIEVSAENVELSEDEISFLKEGKYLRVSIKDSGIGIPKEQLALIFDPYFSTKGRGTQKGMGLGLTMVYSIIKGHDGEILVESEVGVGSTFHIYLPASETRVEKPVAFEKRKPAGKAKILVMDDAEMLLDLVGKALIQFGHEVELAKDGHEAVELFRSASESGEAFDVVVLDLTVKGGMGAKEAIRELLDIDPSVKAILQTGYTDDPIMSRFRDYGFLGALQKPYPVEELNELIQNLILNKE